MQVFAQNLGGIFLKNRFKISSQTSTKYPGHKHFCPLRVDSVFELIHKSFGARSKELVVLLS